MNKEELFKIVKEAHEIGKAHGLIDRSSKWKSLNISTKLEYIRKAKSRMHFSENGEISGPLMESVSRQSFRSTRAALISISARRFNKLMKLQEVAQKEEDWEKAILFAKIALKCAQLANLIEAKEKPEERSKPKASKRKVLGKLPHDFREKSYEAATKTQKPALAVLWSTGCRPAELEFGAEIIFEDDCLSVKILGAKLTDYSGQEWRRLYIDQQSDAGKALLATLEGRTSVTVTRSAKRIAKDFVSIRSKLGRGFKDLSAYCLRHAASADMKATGMTPEEIAAALGHATTRTQSQYGMARQSRGSSAVTLSEAARAVKTYQGRRPERGYSVGVNTAPS